jgi:hydrogenase/urease accessory protein HupE
MIRRFFAPLSLLLSTLLLIAPASAHVTSTGLAILSVEGERLTYRLNLTASEMPDIGQRMLKGAADGHAPLAQALADATNEAVVIEADGTRCRPGRFRIQGAQAGDGKVQLELELTCRAAPRRLKIREDWVRLFGEHYQTIISVQTPGGSQERVLGENGREAIFELAGAVAPSGWLDFLWMGAEHILGGPDHLLFLVALLAYARRFWSVVTIVTAFTLAHSITLSLAVLDVVDVPGSIVEPLIAASIVWVALENLVWPGRQWRRWLVSFVFGLVHGLGFASALTELSLDRGALIKALVGFNVGVELGQVAFIAIFLPLLIWASRSAAMRRLPQVASVLVAIMGGVWFVQRVFFE